jgi:uncharacterized integral membrane protein (TIGR00698 family)
MKNLPGVALAAAIALLAIVLGNIGWLQAHGISALTMAIVLGIAVGNSVYPRIAAGSSHGVQFSKQTLLRLGIVLYGIRLTFQDIRHVGIAGVIIDTVVVCSTFALAWFLGTRWLGLDRKTAMLIGAGSSICGAAAVMAAEPVVRGRADQVTVAVSTVVVFGTIAIFLYPVLYHLNLFGISSPAAYGLFAGSTIHEVAQVVAAGRAIGEQAAATAVITKMVRVMLLAPFLLGLSVYLARESRSSRSHGLTSGAANVERDAVSVRHSSLDVGRDVISVIRNVADVERAAVSVRHSSLDAERGAVSMRHGDADAERGAVSMRHGDADAERGAVSMRHGDAGAERGAVSMRHGDAGAERGAVSMRYGDAGAERGAVSMRHGDADVERGAVSMRHGDADVERGAVSMRHGDADAERGAVSMRHGDADAERGAVSMRHGDADVERGAVSMRHGDADAERGAVSMRHGDADVERGAVSMNPSDADVERAAVDMRCVDVTMGRSDAGMEGIGVNVGHTTVNVGRSDINPGRGSANGEHDDINVGHGGAGPRITIPWFALGFVAVTALNSLVALPVQLTAIATTFDTFVLAMAMAALGLTTHVSAIRNAGIRPLALAAVLFVWLIAGGVAINAGVTALLG